MFVSVNSKLSDILLIQACLKSFVMRFINAFDVICILQVMILLTKIFNFSQNFIHFTISLNFLFKLLLLCLKKFSNVMASKMVKKQIIMWVSL